MWSSMTPLRQFRTLSANTILKIEKKEGFIFEHFYDIEETELCEILSLRDDASLVLDLVS